MLDAKSNKHDFRHRMFNSIYIGGGTPTVLSSGQFERIVGLIREHFQVAYDVEFTIEANPNTVTSEGLALLLERGVNRLSLGIQSLSDEILQFLGRLHTAEQAGNAFKLARSTGFKNINIDLIYGIPFQTMSQWEESLDAVIAFRPEHVSAYSLSLDEGSRFYHEAETGSFTLLEDELVATMYERAVRKMCDAGYRRYEVSNFSLPGFECRHNSNYWERGEYLGLGPGAWSFISGRRYKKISDIQEYTLRLSRGISLIDFDETIGTESAARETILLGLRTMMGIDLQRFQREFGTDFLDQLEKNMAPLRAAGLLHVAEGRLKLSERGILLSDEALTRLSM